MSTQKKRYFCFLCDPRLYSCLAVLGLSARKSPWGQHSIFQSKEELEETLPPPTPSQFRRQMHSWMLPPHLAACGLRDGNQSREGQSPSSSTALTVSASGADPWVPGTCLATSILEFRFQSGTWGHAFAGSGPVPAVRQRTISFLSCIHS